MHVLVGCFQYIYLSNLPSLHTGDPFFLCVHMQEPSTLLHNPYLQSREQFCRQASPYLPLSQAIKHNNICFLLSLIYLPG